MHKFKNKEQGLYNNIIDNLGIPHVLLSHFFYLYFLFYTHVSTKKGVNHENRT